MSETITAQSIKDAIKEALKEEREEFWVPQPEHYMDHKFISSIRSGASWGQKIGVGFMVTSTLTFLGWAIWSAIKGSLK